MSGWKTGVLPAPSAQEISVSGLSLSFGGKRILSDVSFSVGAGALVFILGRNGAGKSSLFKCIAGVISGYSGEISIGGALSGPMPSRARARLIAYVPQSSPGSVPFTVAEFLEMSRYPWKTMSSEANDQRAVAEAMALTSISGLAGCKLANLSGGERQKVMIAAAIAQGTGAILMDEPTTYLDYAHQVETMEVMARVNREKGITLMVVTHDVNLAMEMAGDVVAMDGGRVKWIGAHTGLLEAQRLREIYGVRFRQYSSGHQGENPVLAPERANCAV